MQDLMYVLILTVLQFDVPVTISYPRHFKPSTVDRILVRSRRVTCILHHLQCVSIPYNDISMVVVVSAKNPVVNMKLGWGGWCG